MQCGPEPCLHVSLGRHVLTCSCRWNRATAGRIIWACISELHPAEPFLGSNHGLHFHACHPGPYVEGFSSAWSPDLPLLDGTRKVQAISCLLSNCHFASPSAPSRVRCCFQTRTDPCRSQGWLRLDWESCGEESNGLPDPWLLLEVTFPAPLMPFPLICSLSAALPCRPSPAGAF